MKTHNWKILGLEESCWKTLKSKCKYLRGKPKAKVPTICIHHKPVPTNSQNNEEECRRMGKTQKPNIRNSHKASAAEVLAENTAHENMMIENWFELVD